MDTRLVHQESAAYRCGYDHGLEYARTGRERRCPVSGNPLGEMDYAWGFKAAEVAVSLGKVA